MFSKLIHILTYLLFQLCITTIGYSQPASSYEQAEKVGTSLLKKLSVENVSHPMKYVVLKRDRDLLRQIDSPNTIYEVRYPFDLNSSTLEMPENCVLKFNGGSIRNGRVLSKGTQYCFNRNVKASVFECETIGAFERVNYIVRASEVGLVSNSQRNAEKNYSLLKTIVKQGNNLFLDGVYFIRFSSPLYLNSVFHIYGGSLIYENNAFRFADNGGIVVNGSTIATSSKTPDSFFCGQKEYLGAITIKKVAFYNCSIDCSYLVNLYFEDINSDKIPYGLDYLEMDHCVIKNTGRIRVLDAISSEKCSFTNNYYQSFFTTPLYICCHHSVEASPDDKTAYRNIGKNLPKGSPVIIKDNVFIGKPVSENSYYCAALIKSRECQFVGNYIQDVINYNDGTQMLSGTASSYDAYLSCVSVLYEGNFVKDMMSFSTKGGGKPDCQIGKSKTNPLFAWGWKSERIYRNNCFIVDGSKMKRLGAEEKSLYTDILGNGTYIDRYVWSDNTLIYKDASIKTGVAANSYGSFSMERNYFEIAGVLGNGLVTVRSDQPLDSVRISDNVFRQTATTQMFPLFNQKYYRDYKRDSQKLIEIIGNKFYNTAPKVFFFTGENIQIKRNSSENTQVDGNLYLSKYNGSEAYLDVANMDVDLQFSGVKNKTGGMYQYLSSSSEGSFSVSIKDIPSKGVYFIYKLDKKHRFIIECSVNTAANNKQSVRIPFQYNNGRLWYEWDGKRVDVTSRSSSSKTWLKASSISFKSTFYPSGKDQIYFYLSPGSESSGNYSVVLTYSTD